MLSKNTEKMRRELAINTLLHMIASINLNCTVTTLGGMIDGISNDAVVIGAAFAKSIVEDAKEILASEEQK